MDSLEEKSVPFSLSWFAFPKGYGWGGGGCYSSLESSRGCHGNVSSERQVGFNEEQATAKQLT